MTKQVDVVPVAELNAKQLAQWSRMQRECPALDNPHFCPEFAQAVADVRGGIEVAIVGDTAAPQAFLAFHRDRGSIGKPIAGPFSDFQGVVAPPGIEVDSKTLLRECGLSSLRFETLLANQRLLQDAHAVTLLSPFMDLSGGFEAYRVARRQAGTDEIQETLRKTRKMKREHSAFRFEVNCREPRFLDMLIDWKLNQFAHSGEPNGLALPWARPLMHRVFEYDGESFAGMLSVLWVGDQAAAATFSMRSHTVLHGWLAAYNPEFRKYSPGSILLLQIAQAAESLGVRRIDMGRGPEPYKRSFASGAIMLEQGSLERSGLTAAARSRLLRFKEWVRSTPVGPSARRLVHGLRSVSEAARG